MQKPVASFGCAVATSCLSTDTAEATGLGHTAASRAACAGPGFDSQLGAPALLNTLYSGSAALLVQEARIQQWHSFVPRIPKVCTDITRPFPMSLEFVSIVEHLGGKEESHEESHGAV